MRDINEIIDEAIESLADDNITIGADALIELANQWSKAGLGQNSFQDIRKYIIDEASARTDVFFIAEKLKIIEKDLQNGRKKTWAAQ